MSDFANFEGAEQPQAEEDPAAAFLAREQDDLAALESDDFVSSEPTQDTTQTSDFGADAFGAQEPTADPTSAADASMFDPYTESATTQSETANTEAMPGESTGSQQEETSDSYTAAKQTYPERVEPEKIRIWREQQKERLIKKDAESEEKKRQWREIAKKELEDWYRHRAEQLEKTKKNNREGEAAFIQERDENVPGHEWEVICRHCDFNPKASRNSKDVSRMRSILLQLKQSPLQRS